MKRFKINTDKVFEKNEKITLRNIIMLIKAQGVVYLENNPHLDRIKHMLEEVDDNKQQKKSD